jgi:hypothetical protein
MPKNASKSSTNTEKPIKNSTLPLRFPAISSFLIGPYANDTRGQGRSRPRARAWRPMRAKMGRLGGVWGEKMVFLRRKMVFLR